MTVRGITGKGREKKKPRKSGLPQSVDIGSGVHGRGQTLTVDVAAVAEKYLIFLVAFWCPLIKGVMTEYDVIFFAVVLYADDLLDDIAFRAVHVGCVFDKIRYLTHGDSPLFITVKYFEKVFAKLLVQPLYVVVTIIPFVGGIYVGMPVLEESVGQFGV